MNLPLGFRYAAVYAGIRKVAKNDLALIVSDTPAASAAVFTQNQVVAAPVTLAKKNFEVDARQVARMVDQRRQRELCHAHRSGSRHHNHGSRGEGTQDDGSGDSAGFEPESSASRWTLRKSRRLCPSSLRRSRPSTSIRSHTPS